MDFSVKISKIEMQKLQASEGMVLTNGKAYSSVGGVVYLPQNADTALWSEISEEAYLHLLEAQDEEHVKTA